MSENKHPLIKENCWQETGVWGTRIPRCSRLSSVIHCRNCDVFHAASLQAYEQQVPGDYRKDWTALLSADKKVLSSAMRPVIVFRIGDEWVAISAHLCREIGRMSKIHRLPHNKNNLLKGVVNSGGEIQACFSLGMLLGLSKSERAYDKEGQTAYKRMVVLEKGGKRFAFPVNEVAGILHYREDALEGLPETIAGATASYLKGIIRQGDKRIGCIDEELLISQIERSLR